MTKLYTFILLLFAATAHAEIDWQKHQEKDEMTGQVSDPVALIAVNWGDFYPEVEFGCQEDFAYFEITTYEDTMPHTFVNQYGGISTQIRINWGDGNVYTYNPVQKDFSNRFFAGLMGFDPTKINPENFKLELVSAGGQKHHLGAAGYMTEYLAECKAKAQKANEDANKTFEEKHNYDDAQTEYSLDIKHYISKNIPAPALSWDATCVITLVYDDAGEFEGIRIDCDSSKFKDAVIHTIFTGKDNGDFPEPAFELKDGEFTFEYNLWYEVDPKRREEDEKQQVEIQAAYVSELHQYFADNLPVPKKGIRASAWCVLDIKYGQLAYGGDLVAYVESRKCGGHPDNEHRFKKWIDNILGGDKTSIPQPDPELEPSSMEVRLNLAEILGPKGAKVK